MVVRRPESFAILDVQEATEALARSLDQLVTLSRDETRQCEAFRQMLEAVPTQIFLDMAVLDIVPDSQQGRGRGS
ncbi:hypothetical protein ASE61_17025 [Bosea sp. Root670]|nr:hypothetical protein ASE61_17025 [Bosea sp. Root670]